MYFFGFFASECVLAKSDQYTYGVKENCGISFQSSRPFVHENCDFLYDDQKYSPFFYGHVYAKKEILNNMGYLGFFEEKKGKLFHARKSYNDRRNVIQTILKKKNVGILKKSNRDIVVVSLLKVSYDKEYGSNESLISIEETYECWDGLFYGKSTGVSIALCSLHKSNDRFASLDSWQAKLIKSLVVTIGEGPLYPSPSFDCAQSNTKIEKAICANKNLSLLDATLDRNYQQLKASMNNKSNQLPEDQREWLKERNACKTSECLTEAYTHRIDELCTKYSAALDGAFACTLSKDIEFPEQAPE
jgi:uncharacterized protein YecT (DUF1311 family)